MEFEEQPNYLCNAGVAEQADARDLLDWCTAHSSGGRFGGHRLVDTV